MTGSRDQDSDLLQVQFLTAPACGQPAPTGHADGDREAR